MSFYLKFFENHMKQREEKKEEGKILIIITDYNEYIYI